MDSIAHSFQCRSCGSSRGSLVLDLGVQPLANNLPKPEDLSKPEPRFPLRLAVCESCWLLQILDMVPPVDLFSEYLYFSSFSDYMVRHAQSAAERYMLNYGLGKGSLVTEIASNDGYLLQFFHKAGVPCLGIEPAKNIAAVARAKGIETLVEFFGTRLANDLAAAGRQADVVLGNNVFAHAPDTNDFVRGLARLLKPQGRVILEFPYAADFVENNEFDTIYHEHVFYFSLTALQPLFRRHGLLIYDVERIPIHGGSLRLFACAEGLEKARDSVPSLLNEENAKGMTDLAYYKAFAGRVEALKQHLVTMLQELAASGKRIAAYGASAKGSTLLNYFGLGSDILEFAADRSTYKQGRLTPGTHLPIVPPSRLIESCPDYTLLLTWNFAEEILCQQREYRGKGGKFIIPIPRVSVV